MPPSERTSAVAQDFSPAIDAVRSPDGRLTLGLMTPQPQHGGSMADPQTSRELARLAEASGIAALWVRDVPLAIPQGEDRLAASLDDPFLWLGMLAGATERIAIGTAAAVLPLRHPLHLAKTALSLDRISGGRLLLGVATGDRPEEFELFGASLDDRRDEFRDRWALLRSALSPIDDERRHLLQATDGYELMAPPSHRIPQVIVGSAKQTLQWNAAHADAWATYYRPFEEQKGRFGLWRQAVEKRGQGNDPALIQSMSLDLLEDSDAPAEEISLGLRTGSKALVETLRRYREIGLDHCILAKATDHRPAREVLEQLRDEVVAHL
ncbi:TIGR03571 family LLM class oxidoreductase [Kocuria palustris]|uniref:TIGR03571 family LLM class oxidoreductase n=1 Tax=Kocuria palustris TaxID=71999 RepID=UPI0021B1C385|nr:TIGR03571 family LLM class oxidoreductase [Kocuria palustris]